MKQNLQNRDKEGVVWTQHMNEIMQQRNVLMEENQKLRDLAEISKIRTRSNSPDREYREWPSMGPSLLRVNDPSQSSCDMF